MNPEKKPASFSFEEGAAARAAGTPSFDNPYCVGTEGRTEWAKGWSATFDLDEDDDPASTRDRPDKDNLK